MCIPPPPPTQPNPKSPKTKHPQKYKTKQYLRDLECPHAWDPSQGAAAGRLPALRWLLGKAVACDYEDGGGCGGVCCGRAFLALELVLRMMRDLCTTID